jgi:hypothetical protein
MNTLSNKISQVTGPVVIYGLISVMAMMSYYASITL